MATFWEVVGITDSSPPSALPRPGHRQNARTEDDDLSTVTLSSSANSYITSYQTTRAGVTARLPISRCTGDSTIKVCGRVIAKAATSMLKLDCFRICATTTTPMLRRSQETGEPLCNACGLYASGRKRRGEQEPGPQGARSAPFMAQMLETQFAENSSQSANGSIQPLHQDYHFQQNPLPDTSPICHNCGTTKTSLWRRDREYTLRIAYTDSDCLFRRRMEKCM